MSPKTGMYVGVGISVAILLAVAGIGLGIHFRGSQIGEPTATKAPGMLDKLEMKLDLSKLFAMPPAGEGGAEAAYNDALRLANEYGEYFADDVNISEKREQEPKFKAVLEKLEEAADKGLGDTLKFAAMPPVSVQTEWEIRRKLYAMEKLASFAVMTRLEAGDKAGAEKAARAGLIFGCRLYNNGEPFIAYRAAGIVCISDSLGAAQMVYGKDPVKGPIQKELFNQYLAPGKVFFDKIQIILKDPNSINCGDLWNIVEHDMDKAWRVEGIMWLGVGRWTSAPAKQRAAIEKYLAEKAASSDPVVAKYAAEALKVSRADIASIGPTLPKE